MRTMAAMRRSRREAAISEPIAATSSVRPTNTSPTPSGYAGPQSSQPGRPERVSGNSCRELTVLPATMATMHPGGTR